jgi:hypothetical protein
MGSVDRLDKRLTSLVLTEGQASEKELAQEREQLPDLAGNLAAATEEEIEALRAELERGGRRRRQHIKRALEGTTQSPPGAAPEPTPAEDADTPEG